jgi:cytochrome P450 family 110
MADMRAIEVAAEASRTPLPPGPAISEREQTFAWFARPYEFLDECAARFGDVFTLAVKGWGPTVCFARPTAIRELFSAPSATLQAGRANAFLAAALGRHSVIVLDGVEHQERRRQIMPAFHARRIHSWGRAILAIAEDALATWGAGEARPLTDMLLAVSRDIILDVVFGLERADANRQRLEVVVANLLDAAGTTVQSADVGAARDALDVILREEFARRRATPEPERADVLGALLDAPGPAGAPSDDELSDQLVTLLMAGHETTATSLAWAFVELGARPDLTARLRSEIASAGPRRDAAAIASLPYLDAVCKEVLRLRPVVPAVARWVASPVSIDGWTLPAGVHAAACIYLTHRRADVYAEPREFRPERFLGREVAPWEFLPFGGGARRCVGMAFAMFEMKLVLATILARVDLTGANRRSWTAVRHSVCVAPSERATMTATFIRNEAE